jgi:hypothetical protein
MLEMSTLASIYASSYWQDHPSFPGLGAQARIYAEYINTPFLRDAVQGINGGRKSK